MSAEATTPVPRRGRKVVREIVEALAITVLVFVLVRISVQNFRVSGDSMDPTLRDGEYVLVDKFDYLLHSPHRGDIIVFRAVPALQPNRDFIKRIIGLPGERVAVRGGAVYINGKRLVESYIHEPPTYTFPAQTVPRNDYFVLGDHRNDSFDSAKWTTTPWLARRYIIGRAWIAYWPLSDLSFLSAPSLN